MHRQYIIYSVVMIKECCNTMQLESNNHSVFLLNYHFTRGVATIDVVKKYIENQQMK